VACRCGAQKALFPVWCGGAFSLQVECLKDECSVIVKRKVYAYIVQDREVVVFEQPESPEAGIQVPGGTVDAGEALDDAVLREAFEETGLRGLSIAYYLGKQTRDMRDYGKEETHDRYFYYLTCASSIPRRWQHFEQYSSEPVAGSGRLFAFYRVALDSVPPLIAEFDIFFADLRRIIG